MKENKNTTIHLKNFPWDVFGYIFFSCIIAFAGILFGKLTIGFIVSAILMLASNVTTSLSEETIEVITGNFSFLMILIILLVYVKKREKSTMCKLWFYGEKNKKKSFLLGIVIGALVSAFSFVGAVLLGGIKFSFSSFEIIVIGLMCIGGLIQSAGEEVLFRGFLMQGLMKKHSLLLSVGISSLVFAVTHVLNPGITFGAVINITMIGVLLSYIVVKMKSLTVAIGIHFIWNFMEEVVFGTPNSGIIFANSIFVPENVETSMFYNSQFGIEGALQTFVLWTILLLFIIFRKAKQ